MQQRYLNVPPLGCVNLTHLLPRQPHPLRKLVRPLLRGQLGSTGEPALTLSASAPRPLPLIDRRHAADGPPDVV